MVRIRDVTDVSKQYEIVNYEIGIDSILSFLCSPSWKEDIQPESDKVEGLKKEKKLG